MTVQHFFQHGRGTGVEKLQADAGMVSAEICQDRHKIMMQCCFTGADSDKTFGKILCSFEVLFRFENRFAGGRNLAVKGGAFRCKGNALWERIKREQLSSRSSA